MDSQGVSFINQNNRPGEGPRYCEVCFKRGNITPLGVMTRKKYVQAFFPPLPGKNLYGNRGHERCAVCGQHVITTQRRSVLRSTTLAQAAGIS